MVGRYNFVIVDTAAAGESAVFEAPARCERRGRWSVGRAHSRPAPVKSAAPRRRVHALRGTTLGRARRSRATTTSIASTGIGPTDCGHAPRLADAGTPRSSWTDPRKRLWGAFLAEPGASEAIRMTVLAVETRTPIDVLADTITAFPTTARVTGGLFSETPNELRDGHPFSKAA